ITIHCVGVSACGQVSFMSLRGVFSNTYTVKPAQTLAMAVAARDDHKGLRDRAALWRSILRTWRKSNSAFKILSGLLSSHNCYGLPGCSPPVRIRLTFTSAHGGFYIQAFSRSVSLPAGGVTTQRLDSSVSPQERQLASLHLLDHLIRAMYRDVRGLNRETKSVGAGTG